MFMPATARFAAIKAFALFLSLMLGVPFACGFPALGQPASMTVWAVSDCAKVLRGEAPWDASAVWSRETGKVVLHAARNEYVAFQVMVTAGGSDLYRVDVGCSALSRQGGTIPADNVRIFREHYLNVTEPSTSMYGELSTTGPGWYPDPLVPSDAPEGGMPCDVSSGDNQGIWVDIYVPPGTPAGTYSGTVTISSTSAPSRSLPLELLVWGFDLPQETHMDSFFIYQPGQLSEAHGVSKYGDEYLAIEADYARAARLHRCNISTSVYPEYSGSGKDTVLIWDSWHDALAERYLDGTIFPDGNGACLYALPISQDYPDPADHGGLGSPEFEDTFLAMLQQFRDHFQQRGWFERSFLYIVDEPNDSDAYDLVRYYGGLVNRSGTGFPLMVTESPVPQEPSWGSLVGAVDIWCAGGDAWPDLMHERQAAGERAWTYNGGEPYSGSQVIDTSGLGPRSWSWISRRYGVECWLLWDVCYFKDIYNGCWDNDVWTDPITYDQRRSGTTWPDWGNGDGTLFYPGTPRGINGPVESMRLKSWRRGAQDFEYMWLLTQRGCGDLVDELVTAMVPSAFGDAEGDPTSWSKDVSTWEEARIAMGNELDSLPPYTYDCFFAEGYAGSGFQVWLCFGNSAHDEVGVKITFFYNSLPPSEHYLSLPPLSRTTVFVNPYVGVGVEFSTMVESTTPVTCERPIYFQYNPPP